MVKTDETRTSETKGRTINEVIDVAGSELIGRVKELMREGNVRQLRIRASDGDVVLEIPLSVGVIAGGAVVLAAPWLAVLGVLTALVTQVRIEIERYSATDQSPASATTKDEDHKTAA